MCLLAIAWQSHEEFPLVVCANRDEFYARPSKAAHFWADYPGIFAGRDMQGGGTWMGINRNGRFCAVTNIREPLRSLEQASSRGELVNRFLIGRMGAEQYMDNLSSDGARYNGYNLVAFDGRQLVYQSNRAEQTQVLEPGVYAISNTILGQEWPKTRSAHRKMRSWLQNPSEIEQLASLLDNRQPADDQSLPRTGVSLQWERVLSSEFIDSDGYGTRCSTGFLVHRNGMADFCEISHDQGGSVRHEAFPGFLPSPI